MATSSSAGRVSKKQTDKIIALPFTESEFADNINKLKVLKNKIVEEQNDFFPVSEIHLITETGEKSSRKAIKALGINTFNKYIIKTSPNKCVTMKDAERIIEYILKIKG